MPTTAFDLLIGLSFIFLLFSLTVTALSELFFPTLLRHFDEGSKSE